MKFLQSLWRQIPNPLPAVNAWLGQIFDLRPFTDNNKIIAYAVFFALWIVAGLAVKIYFAGKKLEKFERKLISKYFNLGVIMGLLGLGLMWLRYERVTVLAARFWLGVWVIIAAYWIYRLVRYQKKVLPETKKLREQRQQFQKYLPKKKR